MSAHDPATEFWLPEASHGEMVPLERLEAAAVQAAIAYWRGLKGARPFPARAELKPRDLAAILPHILLVRVLGDDYQYRIVGDALVQGFNLNFTGRRLSDIVAENPQFGLGLKMLYDMVRAGCAPVGYRGWAGRDMPGAGFTYHESALLPFGPGGEVVDHIMIASMIVLKPGARFLKAVALFCLALLAWPLPALCATVTDKTFIASDGTVLPLRHWDAEGPPRLILAALHGMNDYSHAFEGAGIAWAAQGITTYAYDQRGFGAGPDAGRWAGDEIMRRDFCDFIDALHARFPGVPVFAAGESMGGAVILTVLAHDAPDCRPVLSGAVLMSPAVWSRSDMPMSYRVALYLGAHLFPAMTLSGRGLHILPSDNLPMLRALAADPLMTKGTRIDAIAGLTDLMDQARAAPVAITDPPPLLMLRGDKDPIIPAAPSEALIVELGSRLEARHYPNGYHMLTRDLDGSLVQHDIAAWLLAHVATK